GEAGGFTGRSAGSPRVPFHPSLSRPSPVTGTNGVPTASAVTWRPRVLRPVPGGPGSGGGKLEGIPAAVRLTDAGKRELAPLLGDTCVSKARVPSAGYRRQGAPA